MATILLVDDRPSGRHALATLLAHQGHRVIEAGDGAEALAQVRTECPDLAISDVVMPGVDGYQFVMQLRLEAGECQPRVILMSGTYSGDEDRQLAERCGVSRFIAKPADPPAVLAAVAAVLAEPVPEVDLGHEEANELVRRHQHLTATKLAEQVTKLEELHATLDQRVSDRTLELERAIVQQRQDEEALQRSNARLSEQVVLDPLTGLFNRRHLEDALQRQAFEGIDGGKPIGLMMIDIDLFKRINDELGHAAGDAVLVTIAQCLQSFVRGTDLLCRYGGEEFALLLGAGSATALRDRADELRDAVQWLDVDCGGIPWKVTISIGMAMHPGDGATWSEALRAADAALYRAKRSGRNRIEAAPGATAK